MGSSMVSIARTWDSWRGAQNNKHYGGRWLGREGRKKSERERERKREREKARERERERERQRARPGSEYYGACDKIGGMAEESTRGYSRS